MNAPSPELRFACPARECDVVLLLPNGEDHSLLLPRCSDEDEEHHLTAGDWRLVLRRVHCVIADGLIRRGEEGRPLSMPTRAALLWRAFNRYRELVGLKRLTGGLSGSEVLVFRPRLKAPHYKHTAEMASSGPSQVLEGAWGSPLLVKTGPFDAISQEWRRSETFLRDRQSPFLARNEELLQVRAVGRPEEGEEPQATLISSFLGGDLLQAESFDKFVRGAQDVGPCLEAIDQVVDHLATWHTNPIDRRLADAPRFFRFPGNVPPTDCRASGNEDPWLLFGRFNFRKRTTSEPKDWDMPDALGQPSLGRAEFAHGLGWDVAFGRQEHLGSHLLGKPGRRDGLLHRLMDLPARFSLVHGDLNPRNILCDPDKVWLIDFQNTGVGPILADFAWLEANFRLWCIELKDAGRNAEDAAAQLELLLLDHFHGSECSLAPVRGLAAGLGADPDELLKIARCIAHLRQRARRWCCPEFADGRDYLALLYLTVLNLLRYAAQGHTAAGNERWTVGLFWVLEESLDRILAREPYDRGRQPYNPLCHVSADLVADAGAARRVHYLCSTDDGRESLEPVVALRGVLQGSYHHLDVYQHTLSVLAYMEALLPDPVAGLLNPAALDAAAARQLALAGLDVPPPPAAASPSELDAPWFAPHQDRVRAYLASVLTSEASLLLKWCALLHDVGKPGARAVRETAGGPEVQFLGHEIYGLGLLQSRLAAWFAGEASAAAPISKSGLRLSALIRNHHRSHQLIGDNLLRDPERAAELYGLLACENRPRMLKWLKDRCDPAREEYRPDLPLLLLHGYADRLAARGPRQSTTIAAWAAVTLGLLTFLASESD